MSGMILCEKHFNIYSVLTSGMIACIHMWTHKFVIHLPANEYELILINLGLVFETCWYTGTICETGTDTGHHFPM